jgi:hypothetical protein
MKKRENIEIELDLKTIEYLETISKDFNMTLDETINEILENYISKKITMEEYIKLLQEYKDLSEIKSFYTIVDKDNNPIIRVRPL